MKDHRYGVEFSLNENLRYKDDPNIERYEIVKIDGKEYLVFVVSLVKVAFAMDEAMFFDGVTMNLELRADRLDSFSKVGNFKLSIAANIAMVAVFLGLMYALFPALRTSAFAVFTRKSGDHASTDFKYSSVSQKEETKA